MNATAAASGGEENAEILDQLAAGEINAEEAIRRLAGEQPADQGAARSEPRQPAGSGWLVGLASGLALTALGGWLATIGGWWFACAIPALMLGIAVLVLAALGGRSPWVHLRIHAQGAARRHRLWIDLPLPVHGVAWILRTFGARIEGLDKTGLDELILALDERRLAQTPLTVDVRKGEEGERIRVTLG
ncbi:MAG TPA: hypothetical protein VJ123_10610 [Anaerolineales bacterium]|nr:hypothetical protein [Anaerolineales bacterium]